MSRQLSLSTRSFAQWHFLPQLRSTHEHQVKIINTGVKLSNEEHPPFPCDSSFIASLKMLGLMPIMLF